MESAAKEWRAACDVLRCSCMRSTCIATQHTPTEYWTLPDTVSCRIFAPRAAPLPRPYSGLFRPRQHAELEQRRNRLPPLPVGRWSQWQCPKAPAYVLSEKNTWAGGCQGTAERLKQNHKPVSKKRRCGASSRWKHPWSPGQKLRK